MATDEKKAIAVTGFPAPSIDIETGSTHEAKGAGDNDFEVFKKTEDGVDFRTVSWLRAAIIFLKGTLFETLHSTCVSWSFPCVDKPTFP